MLITIAILTAALCGYGLGFRASKKYHRQAAQQAEAELIAQVRDTVCNEIFEIAKKAQADREAAK